MVEGQAIIYAGLIIAAFAVVRVVVSLVKLVVAMVAGAREPYRQPRIMAEPYCIDGCSVTHPYGHLKTMGTSAAKSEPRQIKAYARRVVDSHTRKEAAALAREIAEELNKERED